MITLDDLMDASLLAQMLEERYVKMTAHPTGRLCILNYTAAAQYDRVWNDVTRQCRGLIYDENGVVARPWPKFHNYGEHEQGLLDGSLELDLEAPVEVTDKLDGSLGILYREPDGQLAIATRGSFTSDQAVRATRLLRERYADWMPLVNLTYLFEIIYPENRIVVDYKGLDDLVLLGCTVTDTGDVISVRHEPSWPGRRVPTFQCETLADALALEPRENKEGLVVRYLADNEMLKIKQEDYVALHKLVTGLNERTVWQHLRDGGTLRELLDRIPDEFHEWVEDTGDGLYARFDAIYQEAWDTYRRILAEFPALTDHAIDDRKMFALQATQKKNPQLLFMLWDGYAKESPKMQAAIWKMVKPDVNRTLLAVTEDTA